MEPLPENLTYKEAIEQLESIVEQLEKGGIELEEALVLYQSGTQLLSFCNQILDQTQQKLEKIGLQSSAEEQLLGF
ncbi:MAG: exodeoxyribonuclease VII small subunit [Chloroflexi bacterium]|nr:exodeoxyribonuclease VII small subunit [Chloroflexota bacterium]